MPTDEDLSPAESLFLALCDLPQGEQRRLLEEKTADSPELRDEVAAMLAADARSGNVLDDLSDRLQVSFRQIPSNDDRAGQDCGKYTLLERLGRGGMGDVWLAERNDGRFDGRYAVKLLRRVSATQAAVLRFEKEGRLLGRLTHRNIARLIDAGAADDQPYLVLEYVEGEAIDDYCQRNELSIADRVELFLQVLNGVAHAHANLVVHRDLKPSNIFVTPSGTVKLLDFGVATLIDAKDDEAGSLTQMFGQVLTPDYAAPEQLTGQTVSTATDVFSLGLVLYQLLVGENPRAAGERSHPAELASVTVPPASQQAGQRGADDTRRALSGDLDNILRKATDPDPAERYQSAVEFATDLKNHLEHKPVTARSPTLGYRAAKFVRRYRGGVATSVLFVIAILSAALIANALRLEAERQRDFAIYQQQVAATSGELLYRLLNDNDVANESVSVADVFRSSAATLERQMPSNERYAGRLFFDLAKGFESLALRNEEAAYLERALASAEASGDYDLQANVLCEMSRDTNETSAADALAYFERAQDSISRVARLSPDTRARCARAEALMLENDGTRDEAIRVLEQARAELATYPVRAPLTELHLLNELGNHYFRSNRLTDAQGTNAESIELLRATGRLATEGGLITQLNNAALLGAFGRVKDEHDVYVDVLATVDELSPNRGAVLRNLAVSHMKLNQPADALAILEPMVAGSLEQLGESAAATLRLTLARAYLQNGEFDRAEPLIDAAYAAFSPSPARHERYLTWISRLRVEGRWLGGDTAGALQDMNTALAAVDYPNSSDARMLPVLLEIAAGLVLESGEPERALDIASDWRQLAEARAQDITTSADVGRSCAAQARALQSLGRTAEATAALGCAVEALGNGLGRDHPETRAATEALAAM